MIVRWLLAAVIGVAILGGFTFAVVSQYRGPVEHGTVVSKAYTPAHPDLVFIPQPKGGIIPFPTTTPECWGLHLQAPDGRTATACVTEKTWLETDTGRQY